MTARTSKLRLTSETVLRLSTDTLAHVHGGDLTSGQLGRERRAGGSDPYFTDGCRDPNPPGHGPSVWQPGKPLTDQPVPIPRPRPATDGMLLTLR